MEKMLVRSYAIGDEGDLVVTGYAKNGTRTNLSPGYEDIPRDRRQLRKDAYLDVFRYDSGDLIWSATPNGDQAENAVSLKLLLDAFVQDMGIENGQRSL